MRFSLLSALQIELAEYLELRYFGSLGPFLEKDKHLGRCIDLRSGCSRYLCFLSHSLDVIRTWALWTIGRLSNIRTQQFLGFCSDDQFVLCRTSPGILTMGRRLGAECSSSNWGAICAAARPQTENVGLSPSKNSFICLLKTRVPNQDVRTVLASQRLWHVHK